MLSRVCTSNVDSGNKGRTQKWWQRECAVCGNGDQKLLVGGGARPTGKQRRTAVGYSHTRASSTSPDLNTPHRQHLQSDLITQQWLSGINSHPSGSPPSMTNIMQLPHPAVKAGQSGAFPPSLTVACLFADLASQTASRQMVHHPLAQGQGQDHQRCLPAGSG